MCLPLQIFFEHCLDVFTTSLSSNTKAVNRSCLLAKQSFGPQVQLIAITSVYDPIVFACL